MIDPLELISRHRRAYVWAQIVLVGAVSALNLFLAIWLHGPFVVLNLIIVVLGGWHVVRCLRWLR